MYVVKLGGQFFSYPDAVKRVSRYLGEKGTMILIAISALKGVTRILELLNLVNSQRGLPAEFRRKMIESFYELLDINHRDLIDKLFMGQNKKDVITEFNVFIESLKEIVEESDGVDSYHRIVQYGELISSMIYHRYLNSLFFKNVLINAPDYVVTNSCKDGQEEILDIKSGFIDFFNGDQNLFLTQGFIGRDTKGNPTTLGNDGSDYTAAKLAEFLHSYIKVDEAIFLKDVRGVYDSDPKMNPFAKIIREIDFDNYEKISQKRYVVRLDAVSTLVTSGIPTTVRSFLNWRNPGTRIIR